MSDPKPREAKSETKPLSVRCAEALGWKRCQAEPGCDSWEPPCELEGWEHFDPLPPYGDDTPEGWACTGPLIQRFGLHLQRRSIYDQAGEHVAYYAWVLRRGVRGQSLGSRDSRSTENACAAIAEWVALYVEGGEDHP